MGKTGLILVFLTALISGFSIFINKFGVSMFSPDAFTTMKNAVVATMLLASILYLDKSKLSSLSRKDWLSLFLIGALGGSLPFLLFFNGLASASAASASLIHKTLFVWVAVFAVFFLREKLSPKLLAATTLLILGNLLFLGTGVLSFGSLLVLAATILWAGEIILSKKLLATLDGTTVAFGRMFFGSLILIPYLLFTNQLPLVASLNLQQAGWLTITSIFLFAYVTTFYNGLKSVRASTAACVLSLGAPITAILNNPALSPPAALGLFLILLGIFFAVLNEVSSIAPARASC